MTIHEYGRENKQIVVLIHPSAVMWDYFEYVIPIMEDRYHLVVPALPGYDEDRTGDFTSVEEIAADLAYWLIDHGYKEIACIYGCSMGGSVVTRFLADDRVKVRNAVIDGGITPYQLPWIATRFIAIRDFLMIYIGKLGGLKLLEKAFSTDEYSDEDLKYVDKVLKFMSARTIWRTFESCYNYKMPDRTGLIMELPPYHKPRWGALIRVSLNKMWQTFKRAIRVVTVAMVILWALSYTKSGNIDGSIIYRFGTAIEPVTLFFGLRWETFIAWLASMFGKEGALGVMAAIFSNTGVLTAISHSRIQSADSSAVGAMLGAALTKPEALAFIFAFYFNIPCIMALSATVHETRSLKWTLIVAAYYLAMSLLIAGVVYHLALLIW